MRNIIYLSLLLVLSISTYSKAQPQNVTPKQLLGYKVGEKFTRHSEVVSYFKNLASEYPENMIFTSYGKTYEGRELLAIYISSKENLKNLEKIKNSHRNRENEEINIVWLSYNVHGNESSGTEAAMQTAWELLQNPTSAYLKNTVVIMDPCMNPDGRDRYVNFYHQYGSNPPNLEVRSVEHNETWPGGRPNHYLFDLNRDWAWMTQIESQQRVALYNQWMPHVHVDFHEQGIDDPYYFPPAAEPYHNVITDWQREFQSKIGRNHAKHFDENGWLYFSKEIFDLLYPSYGDTYPMFSGSIGMTYEQGGSHRGGLAVITSIGDTLSLQDRVDHHVKAGLSTVETASKNARELISAFQQFNSVERFQYKTFVIKGISQRVDRLLSLLDKNNIDYFQATGGTTLKGFSYKSRLKESVKLDGSEYLVTVDQAKGALVEVLFEPITYLSDSLSYDISAWTLPYAYEVECWAVEDLVEVGKMQKGKREYTKENILKGLPYGVVVEWNSVESASFLSAALNSGLRVRYNMHPFEINGVSFGSGSLILLSKENVTVNFQSILNKLFSDYKVNFSLLSSGYVDKGRDMGSSSVLPIEKCRVGLIIGKQFSSLNIGEVWHFFEQEIQYPLNLIWEEDVIQALEKIEVLVYPEGYSTLAENKDLKEWIKKGGHLIVLGSSVEQFEEEEMGFEPNSEKDNENENVAYGSRERNAISETIIGAIFKSELDGTHPLCFGLGEYHTLRLSASAVTMKNSAITLGSSAKALNGFVGYKVEEEQQNSMVAGSTTLGKGKVTFLPDNPLFRGFWDHGKLLFSNALFFN